MFTAFSTQDVDTGEAVIHLCKGGQGPGLLLLHGFPETHLMWHAVADRLAKSFTVVVADLRGCGASSKPASTPSHEPYSKRTMARDMARVMSQLGFETFCVAGHDRGGRVAYRLAIDYPDRVNKLAVLDIIPTLEAFNRAHKDFALGYWPWSFLSQPAPFPETAILADPALYVNYALDSWSANKDVFPAAVRTAYIQALSDPAAVQAICEEFRAAATIDCEHEQADIGRQPIRCPVLAIWAKEGPLNSWYDTLAIWQMWAADVRGGPIAGGHFLPEEAPDATYVQLSAFFSEPA